MVASWNWQCSMELLPNTPAAELVTRADTHAFGTGLRCEMAELGAELRGEMVVLRTDLVAGSANAKVETQRLIGDGMAANAIAVIAAFVA